MSAKEDIDEHVEVEVVRLFAGREPSEAALARCPTLQDWRMLVRTVGARRELVVVGTLASERITLKTQPRWPVEVLWIDRKWRFAVTWRGLWNLGQREEEVGMDLTLPDKEKSDE